MHLDFCLGGGLCCRDSLLYIPFNGEKLGYLCLGNLGIPIGVTSVAGRYWFGYDNFYWEGLSGNHVMVIAEDTWLDSAVSNLYCWVKRMYDYGSQEDCCQVRINRREHTYVFLNGAVGCDYERPLYLLPYAEYAKYVLMLGG